MQVFESSLNITFFQLSTCHDYFLFAHFNLIFYCLSISPCFGLIFLCKSYFIRSISYSSVKNIDSYFDQFIFPWFSCTFSIFKAFCFRFSILTLWCLLSSISKFSFFNNPISFIFTLNVRHSWLRTTNVFRHNPLPSLISFTILYMTSIWQFFCWSHVSF